MQHDSVLWMVDGHDQNAAESDNWAKLLYREGIPSHLWNVNEDNSYKRKRKTPKCPHAPGALAGFELYRLETVPAPLLKYQYGTTPDEALEEAAHRYEWARQVIDRHVKVNGVRWMITRGSSVLARRAAIFAAEDLGVEVYCIEDGLFPVQHDHYGSMSTIVLTPRRAYYEEYPIEWAKSRRTYDVERWAAYHRWWLKKRQTKYSGTNEKANRIADGPVPLAVDFLTGEKRIVWMGQLQGDASLYWNAPDGIPEDAFDADVWYKAHPFGVNDYDVLPRKAGRLLPAEGNIHQILPLCDVVAGVTTNVCLEAWMYRRKVAVYGRPWYNAGGLCADSIHSRDLEFPPHDARFALLDWFIHEVQIPLDDGCTFLKRLHGEVSNRRSEGNGSPAEVCEDVDGSRAVLAEAGA